MKQPKAKPPLTARELLGALGEHITALRPSVNPKPKKKQVTVCGMTARAVNSSMSVARTSLQAHKLAEEKPDLALFRLGPAQA